jgi:phosphatidylglycerophosphate synthase
MKIKLSDIPLYSKDAPWKEILMAKTARPLTWLLLHTGITANQVTFMSMIVALIGCAFMVIGNYWLSLAGLALFCLFMLLDHCDGQVARYRHYSSKAGLYFDSRVHHIVEPLFFICCGIGCYISEFNHSVGFAYLGAGIATAVFYLMRQLMKLPDETKPGNFRALYKEKSFFGKINYFLFQFLRINYPFSLLFFAIILNQTGPVLMFYAMIFMANLVYSFYKTYKELRDSDEPLLLSN